MADTSKKSPTAHVRVVFTVLACVIAVAATARLLVYPKTYGQYGHWRGDALKDQMNLRPPLHTGSAACIKCHEDEATLHKKDVHANVHCESCHGPGGKHCQEQDKVAITRPDAKPLVVATNQTQCLTCHRRLEARPASFPQVDVKAHYAMLHLKNTNTACTSCHEPHEPLVLDKDIHEARLHPLVNRCVDCHKHEMDKKAAKPSDHPDLFECAHCHKAISEDYKKRAHANISCDICHQIYPVSERADRIISHRDSRFCLMCHSAKQEKDGNKSPQPIEWPKHLKDNWDDPEKDKNKTCIDCHKDAYHLNPVPSEKMTDKVTAAATKENGHE